MTQQEKPAAATTGERLDTLETRTRRTFIATLMTANLAAALAFVGACGAYEYMRITSAVSEAQATAAKRLEELDSIARRDARAELAQVVHNIRDELEKITRDMRLQYETSAMTFDLKTRKQLIKFYEDTARKAADDRVEQMRP